MDDDDFVLVGNRLSMDIVSSPPLDTPQTFIKSEGNSNVGKASKTAGGDMTEMQYQTSSRCDGCGWNEPSANHPSPPLNGGSNMPCICQKQGCIPLEVRRDKEASPTLNGGPPVSAGLPHRGRHIADFQGEMTSVPPFPVSSRSL